MDGDCFQGSNIPEAFEGMDPQSHGAEVEDTTKKKKEARKKSQLLKKRFCFMRLKLRRIIIEKKKGLDGKACWKGYKHGNQEERW